MCRYFVELICQAYEFNNPRQDRGAFDLIGFGRLVGNKEFLSSFSALWSGSSLAILGQGPDRA